MKIEKKLPKRFKDKWVKMLRSGKYSQGQYTLRSSIKIGNESKYSYCCLGVACLAAGYRPEDIGGNCIYKDMYPKTPKILHFEQNNRITNKLIEFNDSGKWSFKKIATYIEKYL